MPSSKRSYRTNDYRHAVELVADLIVVAAPDVDGFEVSALIRNYVRTRYGGDGRIGLVEDAAAAKGRHGALACVALIE